MTNAEKVAHIAELEKAFKEASDAIDFDNPTWEQRSGAKYAMKELAVARMDLRNEDKPG